MRAIFLIICFFISCKSDTKLIVNKIWVNKDIKWENINHSYKVPSSYEKVFYFYDDNKLKILSSVLFKGPDKVLSLSDGDAGSIYTGTWKYESNQIILSYHMSSRYHMQFTEEDKKRLWVNDTLSILGKNGNLSLKGKNLEMVSTYVFMNEHDIERIKGK